MRLTSIFHFLNFKQNFSLMISMCFKILYNYFKKIYSSVFVKDLDFNLMLYKLNIPLRIGFKFFEISTLSTPCSRHSSKCSDI